jgi:hypothetical protein
MASGQGLVDAAERHFKEAAETYFGGSDVAKPLTREEWERIVQRSIDRFKHRNTEDYWPTWIPFLKVS